MTLIQYTLMSFGALVFISVLVVCVAIGIGIGVRRAERMWKEEAKKWDFGLSRKSWTPAATLSSVNRPAATVDACPTPVRVIEVVPATDLAPAALPAALVPVQRPADTSWGRHGSGELALQRPPGYVGRHRADRAIDVKGPDDKGPITQEFNRITGRIRGIEVPEVAHVG